MAITLFIIRSVIFVATEVDRVPNDFCVLKEMACRCVNVF